MEIGAKKLTRAEKIAALVDEAGKLDARIKTLSDDLKKKKKEIADAAWWEREEGAKSVKHEGERYDATTTFSAATIKIEGDAEIERHKKILGDRFKTLFKESHTATGQRPALEVFAATKQTAKRRQALADEVADKLEESTSDDAISVSVKFKDKKKKKKGGDK
jgi:hypothetical protein